jgi:hypothetical protein
VRAAPMRIPICTHAGADAEGRAWRDQRREAARGRVRAGVRACGRACVCMDMLARGRMSVFVSVAAWAYVCICGCGARARACVVCLGMRVWACVCVCVFVCARSLVEWGSEGSETKFRRRIRALLVDWLVVSA